MYRPVACRLVLLLRFGQLPLPTAGKIAYLKQPGPREQPVSFDHSRLPDQCIIPKTMMPVTTGELRNVVALHDLPDEHLLWLVDRSEYSEHADGDLVGRYGEPAETMWILLSGKITFYMYVNGRQVYYFTFDNDDVTGGIGGFMPYSRMKTIPGYSYALGEVKLLRLHKKYFAEMEELNPAFIQRLIGYMTNRAKAFATTQLQYEKVNALGSLAAGITHEFNNPAAAISAIAGELSKRVNRNYELTQNLLACRLNPQTLQNIRSGVEKRLGGPAQTAKLATLQRLEKEEELEDWLEKQGISGRETAETLAEYGFSTEELENIHTEAGAAAFTGVMAWLENWLSTEKMLKDLAEASGRISHLVSAIKSHVHLDRTNALQPTDIHRDIENTLALLGFKLREKNITVTKRFCQNMPEVPAFVSELNQVWTNLIDNAIFALPQNGTLTLETTCDPKQVRVSVIDNGIGIPQENLSRIFDPFFTTKKIGEGTGIGLDIVSRVVKRHNGDIQVRSEPGRTAFSVCIPVIQQPATQHDQQKV